jgi:Galactose oxidase, central domain
MQHHLWFLVVERTNSDGALVVLGGRDMKDNFLDDLFLLKLDYHKWVQINVKGMIPRAMHGMTSIKNTLYVFGGYNEKGFVNALLFNYEILFDEKAVIDKEKERETERGSMEGKSVRDMRPVVRWSTNLENPGN